MLSQALFATLLRTVDTDILYQSNDSLISFIVAVISVFGTTCNM